MDDKVLDQSHFSIENQIEALLFVATLRVSPGQLAEVLGLTSAQVESGLQNLASKYTDESGLRLQWHKGKVQLITAPELAPVIEKFLGLEVTSRLSRAALEALSIIAYKQPITKPSIDAIRGVNSDGVVRNLLIKGLIEELGRAEGPGRPIIYATTEDFLHYFGLLSLEELPPLEEEVNQDNNHLLKD
jgi:segregation and condensation protein B